MSCKNKNEFKKEGLHIVKQEGNEAAIIFVHGLMGHPYKTWTKQNNDSLPELLAKDEMYKRYDLFTFGYKTGVSLKQHRYQEISKLLHTELKAKTNYEEVFFVAHSMGGLIVQRLIIDQVEHKNLDFINSVKGIIYLSVPFYGASGGSIAKVLSSFIPPILGDRIISVQVKSLQIFGKELEEQSGKWARYSIDNLSHIRQKNIYGQSDRTVNTFSASPPYIQDSDAVEENHRSICKIDQKSTVYHLISKFLQHCYVDSNDENQVAELELSNYLIWLKEKTNDFIVPGVHLPLNIKKAWASIQVWEKPNESSTDTLETKLKKYHEWERLSEPRGSKHDAQQITMLGKHVVLIGGPGSGKSTLAKRTVNHLVSEQRKTLYVKLSRVSKEMNQGKSFEEALWSAVTEGYTGNKDLFKSLLLQPDVLVADGLDECEPNRKEISSAIRDWVKARSNIQVIITTRPIGYEPAYFHDYHHMEILPLDEMEINRYAPRLIKMLVPESNKVEELFERFKQRLKVNRTASIAARSPLLLNFLIQLSVSGKSFGTYRAELYSKILEEWMRKSDRGEYLNLNTQVALGALEWIGWTLQTAGSKEWGRSEQNLVSGLALFLTEQMNIKKLEAKELAATCLKYWTEKGVLEHLRVGYEDAYTFIHLTLCEYAAARYFTNMDSEKQRTTLLEIYRVPIWRETLLLAGGAGAAQLIVEQLLKLKPDKHNIFNDMVLAAAILAETPPIDDLNKQVLARLADAICSPIPILTYEAGEACGILALQEPEWVVSLASPLIEHEQPWTKIVAVYLCSKAGEIIFDLKGYIQWLSVSYEEAPFWRTGKVSGWTFWNKTIILGLKQLLSMEISKGELIDVAKAISESNLSVWALEEVLELVNHEEYEEFSEILRRKFSLGKYDFDRSDNIMIEGEVAFLKAILNVIPKEPVALIKQSNSLVQLAILYEGMEIGKQIAGDLYYVAKEIKPDSIQTVIKGMIAALRINEKTLFEEIQTVLNNASDRLIYGRLPSVLPNEPDWGRAEALNLNLESLVEALGHPSNTIALNATKLLFAGVGGDKVKPLISNLLKSGDDQALRHISFIIRHLYGDEALALVLERLQGKYNRGFRHLYRVLVSLSGTDYNNQVCQLLYQGISSINSDVAKAAAKAMLETNQNYNEKDIRKELFRWDKQGVLCEKCNISVKGSSCPKCMIIPSTPVCELLVILSRGETLDFNDWLHFSVHERSDVRREASKGLAQCLSADFTLLTTFINDIKEGLKPAFLIDTVFKVSSHILFQIKQTVLTLMDSASAEVRQKLILEISTGKWLSRDEAYSITELALEDENPEVKNQAVHTMRSLKRKTDIKAKSEIVN